MKALDGTNIAFPCSLSSVGIFFSNRALLSACVEQPIASVKARFVLWRYIGLFFANNLIKCKPIPVLQALFSEEKVKVVFGLPITCQFDFD